MRYKVGSLIDAKELECKIEEHNSKFIVYKDSDSLALCFIFGLFVVILLLDLFRFI
jgi:hypothetical protein